MSVHGKVVGKSFSGFTRIDQPQSTRSDDGEGFSVTSVYRTLWASWYSTAPKLGSKHPQYPDATLRSRDVRQIDPGFLCDVTLNYRFDRPDEPDPNDPDFPQQNSGTLPPPRYAENAATFTVPIELHPAFANVSNADRGIIEKYFANPTEALPELTGDALDLFNRKLRGVNSYIVGSVTESVTTYYWSKPASVSEVVGQRSGNWLTISGSVQREGVYWSRTITRQFSDDGWDSTIYP